MPDAGPAGHRVRRFYFLYWLLSSNIFFLIGHNRNFMRYEKEDSGYNEYNIEWQKDISFHWNKQVDKKYQRNNNARRSQK